MPSTGVGTELLECKKYSYTRTQGISLSFFVSSFSLSSGSMVAGGEVRYIGPHEWERSCNRAFFAVEIFLLPILYCGVMFYCSFTCMYFRQHNFLHRYTACYVFTPTYEYFGFSAIIRYFTFFVSLTLPSYIVRCLHSIQPVFFLL